MVASTSSWLLLCCLSYYCHIVKLNSMNIWGFINIIAANNFYKRHPNQCSKTYLYTEMRWSLWICNFPLVLLIFLTQLIIFVLKCCLKEFQLVLFHWFTLKWHCGIGFIIGLMFYEEVFLKPHELSRWYKSDDDSLDVILIIEHEEEYFSNSVLLQDIHWNVASPSSLVHSMDELLAFTFLS